MREAKDDDERTDVNVERRDDGRRGERKRRGRKRSRGGARVNDSVANDDRGSAGLVH